MRPGGTSSSLPMRNGAPRPETTGSRSSASAAFPVASTSRGRRRSDLALTLGRHRRDPLGELLRLGRREIAERRPDVGPDGHAPARRGSASSRPAAGTARRRPAARRASRLRAPSGRARQPSTCSGNADASAETAPIAPPSIPRWISTSGPTKTSRPSERYGSNASQGASLTLRPTKFGSLVAQPPEHVERDRVAARARELVDVERQRRARRCGSREVRELGGLVEREVRRPDHRDGGRACRRRRRQRARPCPRSSGRRSARDVEPARGGLDEEPQAALALLDREQHPLAVRPEGEDAVEARPPRSGRRSGPNASSSSSRPAGAERGHGGGERALQAAAHAVSVSCACP